jgi:hypothetical protein
MAEGLSKIVGAIFFIGTGIGIIYPAFVDNKSLTQIVVSLFEPDLSSSSFLYRWLLVLGFVCSSYILIIARMYRNTPITVVQTHFHLRFLSADGSEVDSIRSQILRANQPKVTAYYGRYAPVAEGGRIPEDQIEYGAYCESCHMESSLDTYGKPTTGFDVIHVFNPPLPYAWYMPLIPTFFLKREYEQLPRFLKRKLVKRTLRVRYIDEYNVPKLVMQYRAQIYPQLNVRVSLEFPAEPTPAHLRARRIKANGVLDIPVEKDGKVAHLHLGKMQNETLRITW